jgi:hypothetical protein
MDIGDGKRCLVLLDISQTNRPRTTECHWITLTIESDPSFSNLLSTLIESSIVRRVVLVLGLEQ